MKNILLFGTVFLFFSTASPAQDKYFTKQGHLSFDASGGMEKIEATSNSAVCVVDTHTGAIQLAVLLKGFEFEKALMQEHFNENYVESDKYPRAEFKGQIVNSNEIDFRKPATYPLRVRGTLSLHGETREVDCEGKLAVKDGSLTIAGEFTILLADYHISIPNLVSDKVGRQVMIRVDCVLTPFNN